MRCAQQRVAGDGLGPPLKANVTYAECPIRGRLPQLISTAAATTPVDAAREATGPRPERWVRNPQKVPLLRQISLAGLVSTCDGGRVCPAHPAPG